MRALSGKGGGASKAAERASPYPLIDRASRQDALDDVFRRHPER